MTDTAVKINQLFTSSMLVNRLMHKYGEYSYFYYEPTDGIIDPTAMFINDFNAQISLLSQNMCVMYKGYTAVYDPTSNYDMREEQYSGMSTATSKSKTPLITNTVTTKEATINAVDKKTGEVESKTLENTVENFFDSTTNVKTTYDGEDTDTFNTIQKNELRRSGNIGVATVPDMLDKEKLIRFTNYLYDLIDKVMRDLTIIVYTGDES